MRCELATESWLRTNPETRSAVGWLEDAANRGRVGVIGPDANMPAHVLGGLSFLRWPDEDRLAVHRLHPQAAWRVPEARHGSAIPVVAAIAWIPRNGRAIGFGVDVAPRWRRGEQHGNAGSGNDWTH